MLNLDNNTLYKEEIEKLYSETKDFLDPNFETKINEDFFARVWEMTLVKMLLDGHNLIKKKTANGPDIQINNNNSIIHIEAVCPSAGKQEKLDSIKNDGNIQIIEDSNDSFFLGDIPQEKIELRLSSAICDKYKITLKRKRKNIINEDEPVIIAISTAKIPITQININEGGFGTAFNILRTLFPIDRSYNCFDELSKKIEICYPYKGENIKSSGNVVNKKIFLSDEYKYLSAIIYSTDSYPTFVDKQSRNCYIIKNPQCLNPLNTNLGMKEIKFILVNDKFRLSLDNDV